jgi:hypothetical protein
VIGLVLPDGGEAVPEQVRVLLMREQDGVMGMVLNWEAGRLVPQLLASAELASDFVGYQPLTCDGEASGG